MVNESSLTQEIWGKKKLQVDYLSPESSFSQGDSDSESTSVSSTMRSSISSATSSLDQNSSNVNGESHQNETLKKSFSKRFATFGSFISSRRRSQSKLSQSSISTSDNSSINVSQSSSIEVSDESSSNYIQKPVPKFSRTGSLRSVKILRSKSKNRSTLKSKKTSIDKKSEISEESHLERATFSSILKDSKFPTDLKHQPGPLEPEEVLPVAKVCPYQHCSLHGHHHHNHDLPQKRFEYLKKRTTKDQKIVKTKSQPMDKSSIKKKEVKVTKKAFDEVDDSIEFYAKSRLEPVSSYGYDDAEFARLLFGVNNFQEKKNEIPVSNNQDSSDVNNKNGENSDGSKIDTEKAQSLKKTNHLSMWYMIHKHMVSGLEAENGDKMAEQVDEEKKLNKTDIDDTASQETEIRKMFAIKLVRDAIEKILLPEVQDDQSTTSEVISEQDSTEASRIEYELTSDRKEKFSAAVDPTKRETEKRAPKRWSYLKKVILLTKFVKELEKVKSFSPKKVNHLPLSPEPEPETVFLRRQTADDKKNSDEWMLDYALQKVVGELAPTQKRKVSLLVKAFETVAPAQDDSQESRSNGEVHRVGSETKSKLVEIVESNAVDSIKTTHNGVSNSDLEKEKHIKMWHMIYQHVAKDIVTKLGSDLLDGEESINEDENDLQEVEDQTERNRRLKFTQSDANKLVRESVDEILLPDVSDNPSQDSQSVSSYIASDQGDENEPEKIEKDLSSKLAITGLQQQKSKNWSKLKKLILLKRSIKALEGFRKLKPQPEILKSDREEEKVELRRKMMNGKKKAEQWMLDYALQHIVTTLTPARKKRVSMLVEAFEAVVPLPEI